MADAAWPGTPYDPKDAPALKALGNAVRGHEGGGPGVTSPQGAGGSGQIIPSTFSRYAFGDERLYNDQDNIRVSDRIIRDLYYRHGKDPARVATGYFSGEGNIAPAGAGQPYRANVRDVNEPVSAYVQNVEKRMPAQQQQWPGKPLQKSGASPQWPGKPFQKPPEFVGPSRASQPGRDQSSLEDRNLGNLRHPGPSDPSIIARQTAAQPEPGYFDPEKKFYQMLTSDPKGTLGKLGVASVEEAKGIFNRIKTDIESLGGWKPSAILRSKDPEMAGRIADLAQLGAVPMRMGGEAIPPRPRIEPRPLEGDILPPRPGQGMPALERPVIEGEAAVPRPDALGQSLTGRVGEPKAAGAAATPTADILAQNVRDREASMAASTPGLKAQLRGAANVIRAWTTPERIVEPETGERTGLAAAADIRKNLGRSTQLAEQMKEGADKFYSTFNGLSPEEGLTVIRWLQKPETRNIGPYSPTPETSEFMDAFKGAMQKIEAHLRSLPQTEQMDFRENFVSQMWLDKNKAMTFFQNRAPKAGSNYFTKKHVFDSYEEGIRNGLVPVSTNPLEIWMRYAENAYKKIATYSIIDDGKTQGRIKQAKIGDEPKGWVKLNYPSHEGTQLYAPSGYAEVFNNYMSVPIQGWRGGGLFALQRASNISTMVKLSVSWFHAGLMFNESMGSGFANAIDLLVGGHPLKALLKTAEAPFYPLTSIARAKQGIKAYLNPMFGDAKTQRIVRSLVDANFRFRGRGNIADEYRASFLPTYWQSFHKGGLRLLAAEGRQGLSNIRSHPLTGPPRVVWNTVMRAVDSFMAPVFEYAVPRLKTGAALDMMRTYLAKNPNVSDAELAAYARQVSDIIDNRFGEMNQDNIFWTKTQKMALQGMLISNSYTYGTLRSLTGAARDVSRLARAPVQPGVLQAVRDPATGVYHVPGDSWWTANMSYLPGLALASITSAAILTYLLTGKPPESYKDLQYFPTGGIDPKTGEPERGRVPSQLGSIENMWLDPAQEFGNKINMFPKFLYETLWNQDWRSDIVYDKDDPTQVKFADWAKWSMQMLGQPIYATQKRPEGSSIPEGLRFLGVSNAPARVTDPAAESKLRWVRAQQAVERDLHAADRHVPWSVKKRMIEQRMHKYEGVQ